MLKYQETCDKTETIGAEGIIQRGLSANEYDLSRSDSADQSIRIDETREVLARIVSELYDLGMLTPQAVARIAGLDQIYIKDED